ncbi:hypothetical protein CHS0354_014117 [Potamilus streckersoni]|uniref:Uncharacterized protein n=1 Tax=Potamilus streckersoni TaxID=2493646 RepID=A0AAE0TJR7_9BIVA|nr:hypothetical protein CHS0354_014117 [Potamilus streckersoni]
MYVPELPCRTLIIVSAFGGLRSVLVESSKRQMPIKVYIWNFQGFKEAWGHASMSLSDGTYISWWPSGGDERKSFKGMAVKAPPVHDRTLDDDIQDEEDKQPDVIHIIPDGYINEEAIKEWWESFKVVEDWHAVNQNCSTVVYFALCNGLALKILPDREALQYDSAPIWNPNLLNKFVVRLLKYINKEVKPCFCI